MITTLTRQAHLKITHYFNYALFLLMFCMMSFVLIVNAQADCAVFPFHKAQPKVERFIMQPVSLRRDFPHGGDDMVYDVTVIASSSRASIKPLIDAVKLANDQQKKAIAIGFAKAAWLCETKSAPQTRRIEAAVKGFANSEFTRNFTQNYHSNERVSTPLQRVPPSQTLDGSRAKLSLERDLGNALAPIPAISTVPSIQNTLPAR